MAKIISEAFLRASCGCQNAIRSRTITPMTAAKRFEELDYRETDLGELILRRRLVPELEDREVFEIILGDAFLMSSLFTRVEEALGELGLAAAVRAFPQKALDVAVGGLGLGHTARAALESPALASLAVVEYLEPVIGWHLQGLVPLGSGLVADPRCRLIHGDFFAMAEKSGGGFDPDHPGRKWHAVLLDIDHSPERLLAAGNRTFYQAEGLGALRTRLHPDGVFGLWSDDPPDPRFTASLEEIFGRCETHVVPFHNPHQDRETRSTVYLAGGVAGASNVNAPS